MLSIFDSGHSKFGETKSIFALVKGALAIASCTQPGRPTPAPAKGLQPAAA